MIKPWTLLAPTEPAPALTEAVGGHTLVAQLLTQRGINHADQALAFLDPACYQPAPPTALFGMAQAAELIWIAIEQRQNILVWGDFDVDGQTSTSLLVAALRRLAGDDRVRFHIPNRFTESHGIRVPMLRAKLTDPAFPPQLILTCDTGIADAEAVGLARDQGVTVVITDHHDLPAEFDGLDPTHDVIAGLDAGQVSQASVRRANAIVNPKLQPAGDPLRSLPGVGVAYKLIQALFALAGLAGEEHEYLDLVALGIVADVAEQIHDARYLLQLGLERLRSTRRTGLLALMDVARLTPSTVDADSIGFQLGPRLNALGRLEDATVAVELLTTRDPIRAGQLAAKLERLNQQRRLLTSQITSAALEMIERRPELLDFNGLVLAHPAWHAGIVGIVASRLVEQFGRPTVLLLNPPGELARGSARSTPDVDIGAAITACAPLLTTFGGHPGAAGVSLNPEHIDRFRRELDRQIELNRLPTAAPGLRIDAALMLEDITLDLATQLQRLAPFGNGNPTPCFMSTLLTVTEDRRLGRDGEHRRLTVQSPSGTQTPVLWFNSADSQLPPAPLDLAYTIGINTYRGEQSLQLNFVAARASQSLPITLSPAQRTRRVHDLRNLPERDAELPPPPDAVWYAEGRLLDQSGAPTYAPRGRRGPAGLPLVLYSVPPSHEVLQAVIAAARPSEIYLVGRVTVDDRLQSVVEAVAGMCKYAWNRDGHLHLERMAARLGQTTAVVRHALLWLRSTGRIQLLAWEEDQGLRVAKPGAPGAGDLGEVTPNSITQPELSQQVLTEALAEVRAYRRFFLRATPEQLGLDQVDSTHSPMRDKTPRPES